MRNILLICCLFLSSCSEEYYDTTPKRLYTVTVPGKTNKWVHIEKIDTYNGLWFKDGNQTVRLTDYILTEE